MPSKVPRRAVDRSGRPIEPHLCILSNPPGPTMLLRHLLRGKQQGVWLQKRSLSGRPPSRDHCTQDRHLVRSFVPYPTWFEHIVVCTFHGARRALRRESQEIESQTPLVSGRPLTRPKCTCIPAGDALAGTLSITKGIIPEVGITSRELRDPIASLHWHFRPCMSRWLRQV